MPLIVSVPDMPRAFPPDCILCLKPATKYVDARGELFPMVICVVCIRAMADAAHQKWPKDMILSVRR